MLNKLNLVLGGNSNPNQSSFMLLMEDISLQSCKTCIEWIIEANFAEDKPEALNLIICSPGGDLNAGFALVDVMKGSKIPVNTIGIGEIASAGLLIFLAGTKGKRVLTPNTSILSHQYTWGSFGKHHELMAVAKEFDLISSRLITHYKKTTGLNENKVKELLLPPHDIWLSSQEAKEYGICDVIKELY
jgi:ATP-dependent Clp protease protease subunit